MPVPKQTSKIRDDCTIYHSSFFCYQLMNMNGTFLATLLSTVSGMAAKAIALVSFPPQYHYHQQH
jgi:hypothetical protein